MTEATTLEGRRDALYKRLETGYERIEREMKTGDKGEAHRWEDVWLQLLAEYEDVSKQIQRAV